MDTPAESTPSVFRGGGYVVARYGLGVAVSLANMLVLTWWIGPHAYGLFVTAVGLAAFLASLARAGVDTYLLRRDVSPYDRVYGVAATLVLGIAVGLVLAGLTGTPLVVRWLGSREFVAPYWALLGTIPVSALTGLATAKLERELNFRAAAKIELASQTCGMLAAMAMAVLGTGVWAAVAGQTTWQVFNLLAAYRAACLSPRPRVDLHEWKRMLSYGLAITCSQRAWQARTLVNPLLVGRFAGAESVAFVALAVRLAESLGAVRLAAGRLAMAGLARLQGKREEFRAALEKALLLQVITLGPLLCGFALAGPWIVPRLMGERWAPSLALFPFVAAGVLVNSVFNLQVSALFVVGKGWAVLRCYATHLLLLAALTILLLPRIGIAAYGWAELLACAAYIIVHHAVTQVAVIAYRKLMSLSCGFVVILFMAQVPNPGVRVLGLAGMSALLLCSLRDSPLRRLQRSAWLWLGSALLPIRARAVRCLLATLIVLSPGTADGEPWRDGKPGNSDPIPATFFGLHFRLDKIAWPGVPFGSLRLWDTDTRWQNLNPAPGRYDFSTIDCYLEAAKLHGVGDILLSLSATPAWASAAPVNSQCDYAATAAGDCAPPSDLNRDGTGLNRYWREFIYALGAHLARLDDKRYARVGSLSFWNEFTRGAESRRPAWLGTNQQLLRLVQDANCIFTGRGNIAATHEPCNAASMHVPNVGLLRAAKIGTPDAVPLGISFTRYAEYVTQFNALSWMDFAAVHAYPDQKAEDRAPENGLQLQWRKLAAILPIDTLPIWSTEGSWGDMQRNLQNADMQMGYLARYFLVGWSLGFRRMYWYAADNTWGRLIRQNGVDGCDDHGSHNGCSTRAATAWTQVYRWMVGNTMTRPCAAERQGVWTCVLQQPGGAELLALWDATQTCAAGSCTKSLFKYPSQFSKYYTLDDAAPHPLTGGKIWIGYKPILLAP